MATTIDWVLLAYRLPREPSTARVTVWRKLRRLGVVQLVDGLVALPADSRTREQLDWIADEVLEGGGEATVWVGRPGSRAQERAVATRMAHAIAAEYHVVIEEVEEVEAVATDGSTQRMVSRLRRELQRIGQRDFFPPPERELARQAVDRLVASMAEVDR